MSEIVGWQTTHCVGCHFRRAHQWTGFVTNKNEKIVAGWCSDRCRKKWWNDNGDCGEWIDVMGLTEWLDG